jgi:hypothetical protein
MTDDEYDTFARAFRRCSGVYRLKLKPTELDELTRTFAKLLTGYALDDVLAVMRAWMTTEKNFPRPADWLDALRARSSSGAPRPTPRVMDAIEAAIYVRAERLAYEDAPCTCDACVAARVTHCHVRFVPNVTADGLDDHATLPTGDRVVCAGHWAHGDALARWYAARAACLDRWDRIPPRVRRVLTLVASREPGEEG